jgi:hypothetical protein
MGLIAMRLADADVIPYRFSPYANVFADGIKTLTKAAATANLTLDPLGAAVERLAAAARAYDAAVTQTAGKLDGVSALLTSAP